MKLYDASGWGTSSFGAMDYTTNQISQREGSRVAVGGRVSGVVSDGFMGFGRQEYSVVGMNATKIPAVRESIRSYVNAITTHLDKIEPLANANNAFRSEEVQKAISDYIVKVKEYCINLTSQLLAFSDKLADVQEAYNQNMSRLSGNINQQTTSFNGGQRYQEERS